MANFKEFPNSVIEQIGYYVYLLIDPATENVFYVGKGNGNRIFSHLNESIENPQKTDKLDKIQEIRKNGSEVKHIVLRHGLTEKESLEVEAAIIEVLGVDSLTNIVQGHDSGERGKMSINDIVAQYAAQKIDILESSLLINVNKLFRYGMDAAELYEITRGNWVLGERRKNVKFAFTVYRGVVREVYEIYSWFPVDARDKFQRSKKRWRFKGAVANTLSHYIGGDVSHHIVKGNQNPIKYVNC